MISLGLATSLAAVKVMTTGSGKPLEHITDATTDELGATLRASFRAADNLQRGAVGWLFGFMR